MSYAYYAPCLDCGEDTHPLEWYTVWDHIWAEAGMHTHGGWLCIGCLERRLLRRLRRSDFPDVPINVDQSSRSARLQRILDGFQG
jgi:hypothetical protein